MSSRETDALTKTSIICTPQCVNALHSYLCSHIIGNIQYSTAMRQPCIFFVLLSISIVTTAAQPAAATNSTAITNVFKICGSGFGPVTCGCSPKLWPPSIDASCGFDTPICFPPGQDAGACGHPTLEIAFRLANVLRFASPAVFKICYNDLTIAGTARSTPVPLCFGLGAGGVTNLFRAVFPGVSADSFDDSCEATLGEFECNSCSTCQDADGNDGKWGICRYDCGDHSPISNCTSQAFASVAKMHLPVRMYTLMNVLHLVWISICRRWFAHIHPWLHHFLRDPTSAGINCKRTLYNRCMHHRMLHDFSVACTLAKPWFLFISEGVAVLEPRGRTASVWHSPCQRAPPVDFVRCVAVFDRGTSV